MARGGARCVACGSAPAGATPCACPGTGPTGSCSAASPVPAVSGWIRCRGCQARCSSSTARTSSTARSSRCPTRSTGRWSGRSTRCSARSTSCSGSPPIARRARSSSASAPRRRRTASSCMPPYHADRPPVPDDLRGSSSSAGELFEAFGWSTITTADLEADDLLGSLASVESRAGGRDADPDRRPRHVPVRLGAR